ncbi:unnamed protein product [Anisakis simplex]|uniref:Tr-type G domain-containing protein n=1 Tax=Anisakis simplex TaxID=6269 RepID=A0A0M3J8E9_ANISI|nr:unnamed protein product [Anisakis simplex]
MSFICHRIGRSLPSLSKPIRSLLFSSNRFLRSSDGKDVNHIVKRVKTFADREGRQPRILVSTIDKNGHSADKMVIATGFADLGTSLVACSFFGRFSPTT